MIPSDHELIARIVAHDDRCAFGELVHRHQSAVRRFLRHLTHGDAAWADDLAQETFLEVHRTLPRFAGRARFATWLLGIAHNKFRNARRRQREFPCATLPDHATLTATARNSDLNQDLDTALAQLSPEEQNVVHVCYQQGLSHREAADLLACPLGTLKTHLARSKEKLRHLLAAWNPQT
ncbi:sigma-70 family RNA polymerase sigma factor [Horticoccus luteus]|uniref:Sigma-70 family RNA polymerase sigma factor n=1 Tax=Horticoccus luteus TaxID=2862869 RepID=A0A8F9TVT1_9BACT|nr:sigma-70 family RNA polymerase sigma factor [Horticoccus luteus]QYM80041.1 sigma-70 family RNA polymerase sigma factor [Horticoccus luteus]